MEFLQEYVVVLVAALCVGIGYVLKHSLDFIPNKYIPLILAVIGVVANVWNEGAFTLPVLVGGLASALLAVGAYEVTRNFTKKQ